MTVVLYVSLIKSITHLVEEGKKGTKDRYVSKKDVLISCHAINYLKRCIGTPNSGTSKTLYVECQLKGSTFDLIFS